MWWLLLTLAADAGSVRATVEVGPDGPRVLAVQPTEGSPRRVAPGPLQVVDATGALLGSASFPDPRLRTIITPEGGESALLESARIDVVLPWPEGATALRLGDQSAVPALRSATTSLVPVLVQEAGPSASRLDMVFLAEGYTNAELGQFATDVDTVVDYLLSIEPYGDYASLFNVWRIDVPSAQSGADHPEAGTPRYVDTAFDCTYDCAGIDRLICCSDSLVMGMISDLLPEAEGVMVLVNDPVYGGSGGFNFATSYMGGPDSTQVAAHELGHSLVGLWDEYGYGTPGGTEVGPNCAPTADHHWPEWEGESGVGAFQECSYTTHYRPTENACMMRTLSDDYCPICRQEVVLAMYGRLPGIAESATPAAGELVEEGLIEPVVVVPQETLDFEWHLDGELISTEPVFEVPCGATSGELWLTVRDTTPFVRHDPDGLLHDTLGPWALFPLPCAPEGNGNGDPDLSDLDCSCATARPTAAWGLALIPMLWGLRRRRR